MDATEEATTLATLTANLESVQTKFTVNTNPNHVRQVAVKRLTGLPYHLAAGDDELNWQRVYSVWEIQLGRELARAIIKKNQEKAHAIRLNAQKWWVKILRQEKEKLDEEIAEDSD